MLSSELQDLREDDLGRLRPARRSGVARCADGTALQGTQGGVAQLD